MDDDLCYGISVQLSQSLFSGEGTRWITPLTGLIEYYDEEGDEEQVGKFEFFHVDLDSAAKEGMAPWYVLDHLSNTAPFIALFMGAGEHLEFDRTIADDENFIGCTANLLIGDRLELLPDHRGKGLTNTVFNEMARLFGSGCALLAIKSFPLQLEREFLDSLEKGQLNYWQQQLMLSELDTDSRAAEAKLSRHYESIGFKKLNDEGVMYRAL